ncbi:hypothetical protein [Candidatus Pantoea soli]|uniref:Uncharacterized protein n=1 Tax=Candidatus Pantoea soli TaxID=3098669 RepID=A0A518XDJ5_9GAMM|nr:hypothetical protein [Pantoea soli]QDY42230.1 hypothetical protein D8B20_10135 [Pantoea soli]
MVAAHLPARLVQMGCHNLVVFIMRVAIISQGEILSVALSEDDSLELPAQYSAVSLPNDSQVGPQFKYDEKYGKFTAPPDASI